MTSGFVVALHEQEAVIVTANWIFLHENDICKSGHTNRIK